MKKIELDLLAITPVIAQNQSFAIVLAEKEGTRRIAIVIGTVEAQAIIMSVEKVPPPRPLTHDLLKNVCEEFDIELQEIVINNLIEGVFYSRLVCMRVGERHDIDSRTSDAIALAVRFGCPIYTYEAILDQAGIVSEDTPSNRTPARTTASETTQQTTEKLEQLMQEALDKEDYEKAAQIRDEINRRS